jgi:hypothetical protein
VAATTTRKRTPKPVVRATPRSIVDAGKDDDEFEPLHFVTPDTEAAEDRVVIAYLDDYELSMPRAVPPNVGLKLMRTARKQGTDAVVGEMLEEVLGEEAYERLANYKHLTDEDLAALIKVVTKVVMGALEVPKASSKSA